MRDAWMGPYIIKTNCGKGLFELISLDGQVLKKKANGVNLKPFNERSKQVVGPSNEADKDDSLSIDNAALVTNTERQSANTSNSNNLEAHIGQAEMNKEPSTYKAMKSL